VDTNLHNEETVETDTGSAGEAETAQPDDLIRIEGIGPKISTIVVAAGITSFAELEATDVQQLRAILDEAGIHTTNPSTWPEQARLAAQGKWDELQELQDTIKKRATGSVAMSRAFDTGRDCE
jgi:predicted flap endonuclease-1-like 5' DNA nuclease